VGRGDSAPPPRVVTPREVEFFEKQVRPVLAENCFGCHGPQKQKSGLRLDSLPALLKGGDGGAVVVPGEPDKSPLIQAIRHDGKPKMPRPPKKKLSPQVGEGLAAWEKRGVPGPQNAGGATDARVGAARCHWAFKTVKALPPPPVKDQVWPLTSLDA